MNNYFLEFWVEDKLAFKEPYTDEVTLDAYHKICDDFYDRFNNADKTIFNRISKSANDILNEVSNGKRGRCNICLCVTDNNGDIVHDINNDVYKLTNCFFITCEEVQDE
jgi:hypothetical protein